jgi:hypothetical protein
MYKNFYGEKCYQLPLDTAFDLSRVNRYTHPSGIQFWYDPQRNCIVSDDEDLFIQTITRADFGNIVRKLVLHIDDLKIQFSKHGSGCIYPYTRTLETGETEAVWEIEEIGSDLPFYTGHDDARTGATRPREERYQILTNANRFNSIDQQNRGIDFVRTTLSYYSSFSRAISGNERPARVVFSTDLQKQIRDGKLVNV